SKASGAPSDTPAVSSDTLFDESQWKEFAVQLEKGAKEYEGEMKLLEKNFDKDMKLFEKELKSEKWAELGKQFPVPSVNPVPPKDPRQKPRDRERRRIPEGWVESTEPFTRTFNVTKGATLLV